MRTEFTSDFSPNRTAGDQVDLSLSVVLPVHNAESSLTHNVYELLDVLPEIAARFEILIVDDGSLDHTEEIAHELSRCFPQVRVVRHARRRGAAAALQTGMTRSTGDVVFVHDEATPISATELRQLWEMRHDGGLVMAGAETPRRSLNSQMFDGLSVWGDQTRHLSDAHSFGGVKMIRREAAKELASVQAEPAEYRAGRPPRPNLLRGTAKSASI
jgi:glycosyltransferase involved in cell wall biosynthesis